MARKKISEIASSEKELQEKLDRELIRLREDYYYIPKPSHILNIGDEVIVGNLQDCVIEEVLDDGKIYKIDYTKVDNNYGRPIITKHQKGYFSWLSVRKKSNKSESFIKNRDLRINYSQQSIDSLLHKVYYFGVDFEPDYQREYVWNEEDKVALIDSIFNHVEIGKFVFIDRGALNPYEILDGKQRLRTLCDYYEDRFKYNGCYYSDLCKDDQYHFRDYPVSVAELPSLTKEQTLRYFLMLNTTGKQMSKEQLNKVRRMLESL